LAVFFAAVIFGIGINLKGALELGSRWCYFTLSG
jgi:hypothetical protein